MKQGNTFTIHNHYRPSLSELNGYPRMLIIIEHLIDSSVSLFDENGIKC